MVKSKTESPMDWRAIVMLATDRMEESLMVGWKRPEQNVGRAT